MAPKLTRTSSFILYCDESLTTWKAEEGKSDDSTSPSSKEASTPPPSESNEFDKEFVTWYRSRLARFDHTKKIRAKERSKQLALLTRFGLRLKAPEELQKEKKDE